MKKIVIEDTIQGRIIRLTVDRQDSTTQIIDRLKQRYKKLRKVELALLYEDDPLDPEEVALDRASGEGAGKAPRFELCAIEPREDDADDELELDEDELELDEDEAEVEQEQAEEEAPAEEDAPEEEDAEEEIISASAPVKPIATAVDPSSNTDQAIEEMKQGAFAQGAAKLLAVRGLIDPKETEDLIGQASDNGGFLDLLMASQSGLRERVILSALASAAGCQYITSDQIKPTAEALRQFSHDVARRIPALPIELTEDGLVVAVENPFSAETMEDLELLASRPVLPKMALRSAVLELLESAYADLEQDAAMADQQFGDPHESTFTGVDENEETMVSPPEAQQALELQMQMQEQMLASQKAAEEDEGGDEAENPTEAVGDEVSPPADDVPAEVAAPDAEVAEASLEEVAEEAQAVPAPEPEAEPEAEAEAEPQPEPEAQPQPEPETDPLPESGPTETAPAAVAAPPAPPAATAAPMAVPPQASSKLSRQATVRYYSQMNPLQNFPLTVVLAAGQLSLPLGQLMRQVSGESHQIAAATPKLRLRPCFPGCISVPAESVVDVTPEQTTIDFWITPLVEGELPDATLEVYHQDVLLETIQLPAKVVKTTWAKVTLTAGVMFPVLGAVLEMFGLQVKDANVVARIVSGSGGLLVFSLLMAAALIAISLGLSWLKRPKQALPQTAEL